MEIPNREKKGKRRLLMHIRKVMNFKRFFPILVLGLFLWYNLALGQSSDIMEDYTQNISGSDLEIEMVAIPAGEFLMGSPENESNRLEDEGPVHAVKIDAFWMSKYEITWDLYKLFLQRDTDDVGSKKLKKGVDIEIDATSGATVISNKKGKDVDLDIDAISGATLPYVDMSLGMGTGENLPVGNVTQLAASKFCQWLSAKTGHFYRLPTEAEWEYAARAGSQSAYHFGDDLDKLDDYAWYYENSDGSYKPVGTKLPNKWGLYDMHGNVAEWTLDAYTDNGY